VAVKWYRIDVTVTPVPDVPKSVTLDAGDDTLLITKKSGEYEEGIKVYLKGNSLLITTTAPDAADNCT
jgi:hypothetical protein